MSLLHCKYLPTLIKRRWYERGGAGAWITPDSTWRESIKMMKKVFDEQMMIRFNPNRIMKK
jgi:chitinase